MLNQALNEIESALGVLSQMAASEETVTSESLETVTNKVHEAIAILKEAEHSLQGDKLTVVSSPSKTVTSQSDYYEETWQKTA